MRTAAARDFALVSGIRLATTANMAAMTSIMPLAILPQSLIDAPKQF
jgi:hypothetical protein